MIELHPDEKIVLVVHRYWLPIAAEGFLFLLLALVPSFILASGVGLSEGRFSDFVGHNKLQLWFFAAAWASLFWLSFAIRWTNHYLDVLVVTTKRVIDIEQIDLFHHDFAELRLENIEDLRVQVVGFLGSLLNFGNLHIQNAGETKEFLIQNIQHPHNVKDAISRQHEALAGTPKMQ